MFIFRALFIYYMDIKVSNNTEIVGLIYDFKIKNSKFTISILLEYKQVIMILRYGLRKTPKFLKAAIGSDVAICT